MATKVPNCAIQDPNQINDLKDFFGKSSNSVVFCINPRK